MSFRLKSAGHEAKEQTSHERYPCKAVEKFVMLCSKKGLDDFERAWSYYASLSYGQKRQIREYEISPGRNYLKDLYNRVHDLHPSGTAGVVGQYMLKNAIWAEFAKSLGEAKKSPKKPNKNLNKPRRRS